MVGIPEDELARMLIESAQYPSRATTDIRTLIKALRNADARIAELEAPTLTFQPPAGTPDKRRTQALDELAQVSKMVGGFLDEEFSRAKFVLLLFDHEYGNHEALAWRTNAPFDRALVKLDEAKKALSVDSG